MNRKAVKMVAIIIIIAMVITSFSFIVFMPGVFGAEAVYAATTPEEQKYLDEKTAELEEYLRIIHDNYKDEVDYETLMDGAFEGAIESLEDPYSVYYVNTEDGEAFIQAVTGEYEGIGIGIALNKDNLCEINSLAPDAPAEKAGIKVGDVIINVDGQDVIDKDTSYISSMLKGSAGTQVKITIKRAEVEQKFTITRAKIIQKSVYYEMLEGKIGYIRLTGFDSDGANEFNMARVALMNQGADSLIVDIRDNGGGIVDTALSIADQFISSGALMHYAQKDKILFSHKAKKGNESNVPTVLLVNEYSASASEILAGALQDKKIATVVGVTTYGKGIAQQMNSTSDESLFKLSTLYFLTPNKHVINSVGIQPDVVVRNSLGEYSEEVFSEYQKFAPFAETVKPKAGDVGLNVYAAQQRLMLLGYKVSLNATMDGETVSAIKLFQKESGLSSDGGLDFATMKKLESEALAFAKGDSKEDLQMKKAIELLSK